MTAEFVVAVHAIVFLNHKKTEQSSEEIAENVCTNPARVRKVMLALKKAGLVKAHGSASGGYRFVGEASRVTLLDVFSATAKGFVKVSWRSGSDCAKCPISRSMAPIMDGIFNEVDDAGRLVLSKITIADIDQKIFPPESSASTAVGG